MLHWPSQQRFQAMLEGGGLALPSHLTTAVSLECRVGRVCSVLMVRLGGNSSWRQNSTAWLGVENTG